MKDCVKDVVPATLPDCVLIPVVLVGVPSDPRVLLVSPDPVPSVLPDLAKSWNADPGSQPGRACGGPDVRTAAERPRGGVTLPDDGREDVSSEVRARICLENLFALRMAALAKNLFQNKKPWLVAAPAESKPSVFRLPEFRATFSHTGVTATKLDCAATGYDNTTLLAMSVSRLPCPCPTGSTDHCPQAKTIFAQAGHLRIVGDGVTHCCLHFFSIRKVSPLGLPHQMHHATGSPKTHRSYGSLHSSEVISKMRRICVLLKMCEPFQDLGKPQKLLRGFLGTLRWDRYWLAFPGKLSLNALAFDALAAGFGHSQHRGVSQHAVLTGKVAVGTPTEISQSVVVCRCRTRLEHKVLHGYIRANLLRRWAQVAQNPGAGAYVIGSPMAPRQV